MKVFRWTCVPALFLAAGCAAPGEPATLPLSAVGSGGPAALAPGEQPLPRRAFFGAELEPVSEGGTGARVSAVFEGHTAERHGLRAGDVIVSVGETPIATVNDLLGQLHGRRAGDRFLVGFRRDGEPQRTEMTLGEMPRESHPGIDVLYDEVAVEGSRRRTILTRPAGVEGRLPTVLLVGGIGCYSVDVPLGAPQTYVRILNELTRRGYATMRIEKTGIGDSEGPPCAEQDFRLELAGYIEAARAVRRYPFVDPGRVFLFGHSIGGVHAPLVADAVAADAPLAGLMVKGTVGTSWFGYEMENSRRQRPLYGVPAEELEETLRQQGLCLGALQAEQRTPAEIVAAFPECASAMQFPAHYTYRQQLADLDLPGNWRRVEAPVLVLYGTADFLTTAGEHYFIGGVVNRQRPGQSTVRILEGMDHYFRNVGSFAESIRVSRGESTAEFDQRIYEVLAGWMESVSGRSGSLAPHP